MPGGFLSGLALLCFTTVGDFSRMVSYPTWHHRASSRQETFREWFPIRYDTTVFHLNRKLFAYSFLSGMAPSCFIATRNFSTGNFSTPLRSARNDRTACHHRVSYRQETFLRMVSCLAWLHCVSSRQETFRPEISRLRFAPLEMTERHGAIAFHLSRKLFANGFPSGIAPLRFISIGNFPQSVYNSKQTTAAARG